MTTPETLAALDWVYLDLIKAPTLPTPRHADEGGYPLYRVEDMAKRDLMWKDRVAEALRAQAAQGVKEHVAHTWSEDEAVALAHRSGFAGASWTMGPFELVHLLNQTGAAPQPSAVPDAALSIAMDALDEIALAGMSGTGQESDEAMCEWHARQAWKFIGIAARAKDSIKASPTPPAVVAGEARCPHCDDTGDVHSPDGGWRGECKPCRAQLAAQPSQAVWVKKVAMIARALDHAASHAPDAHAAMRECASKLLQIVMSATPPTPEPQQPDWQPTQADRTAALLARLKPGHGLPLSGYAPKPAQPPEPAPLAVAGDEISLLDEIIQDMEGGFVRCARCGEQEDTKTLDFMPMLLALRARLAQGARSARVAMSPMTDVLIVQIAEDLGVIGPRSRVGDLHTRIGPFARAVEAHHGIPQPDAPKEGQA